MKTERGIDMSLSRQAQRLGFPITGALTRRSERERSRREQLYEDEAGNLYLVRRGILTIVAADGTVY